jgi:VWFA-related protein
MYSRTLSAALGAVLTLGVAAPLGTTLAAQATGQPAQEPTFRVQVDAVTMDVLARDQDGRFVPDLTKDEFEIYEDGVRQQIATLTMSHGGRVVNVVAAAAAAPPEGLILPGPATRPATDASGRVFLFFVDDLHLQVEETAHVRALFKQIATDLLHEGDLFGILSSGSSAIAVDMTYDRNRLNEAIAKIVGHGMPPNDIIQYGQGMWGVRELRSRVQVAFSTIHDALLDLAKIHDRRKLVVWVTDGFDFTPFQESRLGQGNPNNFFLQNFQNFQRSNTVNDDGSHQQVIDPMVEAQKQNEMFSDADLAAALRQLTDEANRANATIYTIDPRGLVSGQQIDQQVNPTEWHDYVVKEQDSMRDLAARTGGLAIVDENDLSRGLKRIDAEASDYYILGYYSTNPNPRGRHKIEIRVTRPGVVAQSRTEYVAAPPPVPPGPAAAPAPAPAR